MFFIYLSVFAILGVLSRFYLSNSLNNFVIGSFGSFPLGTLLVNIFGSLFIGVIFSLNSANSTTGTPGYFKLALMVGFLGALTTFSSFSLDTVLMLEKGRWWGATVYMITTNFLCVIFCWIGMRIGKL